VSRYLLRYLGRQLRLPADGQLVIGRDIECDIALDDGAVSRRHAQLSVTAMGVWIEDLGSHNGVVLRGEPGPKRSRLVPGDTFTIGRTVFALDFAGGRPSAAPPAAGQAQRAPTSANTEVLHIDPTLVQYADAVAALGDEGQPHPARFSTAIGVVQLLYDAGALANARTLLGDALDTLLSPRTGGTLPPLVVVKTRRLLSQLAAHFGADPVWQSRIDALGRAEHT